MPVGALPPAGKGEPLTDVSPPVEEFTENAEMVLSILLAAKRKLPMASNATPKGC